MLLLKKKELYILKFYSKTQHNFQAKSNFINIQKLYIMSLYDNKHLHWSQTQFLEGHSSAEFSSNSQQLGSF